MTRRTVVLVAAFLIVTAVSAWTQGRRHLTLRVEFPDQSMRDIRSVPEGRGEAAIQFLYEGTYYTFYLSPQVLDSSSVVVTIQADQDGQTIDTLRLNVGERSVRTNTSPPFGLSVLGIDP